MNQEPATPATPATPLAADDSSPTPGRVTVGEALTIALNLQRENQFAAAAELYHAILAAVPQHVEALNFLGILEQQRGNVEEGAEFIARAVSIRPDYADAHSNLGNIRRIQGKFAEAEAAYRRAIELAPGHMQAYCNLGAVLRNQKRLEEAEAVLRHAIDLEPQRGDSYFNLANVLHEADRPEEAKHALQSAIDYAPHLLDAYTLLARMVPRQEAVHVYRRLLEVAPDDPVGQHMLAAAIGEHAPPRASDEYVSATFDKFANSFDLVLKNLDYRAPFLVADVVGQIEMAAEGRLDVLDAGCGTGLGGALIRPFARKLVGVDLSAGMLARAGKRQVYDALVQAELTEYLGRQMDCCDLIISADTLVYFGDLDGVLRAAAGALRSGGHLVITLEEAVGEPFEIGYRIERHGRYSHDESYVRRVLAEAGFQECHVGREVLRQEFGESVAGLIVSARKRVVERLEREGETRP